MSSRLNQERETNLSPKRYIYAKKKFRELGIEVEGIEGLKLIFEFKGEAVTFWPYSGWHSGKSITDGRGLKNLLKQLSDAEN